MELKNYDNSILKLIQELYSDYLMDEEELTKHNFFRLMFENKLIDLCDYNLFYLNHYINQLSPESDYLSYEQFLVLLLFIYGQQLKMLKSQKQENQDNEKLNNLISSKNNDPDQIEENQELDRDFPNEINDMSIDSYKVIIENKQFNFPNNTIIRVIKNVREDNDIYIDNVIPDFNENENLFKSILLKESIDFSKNYSKPLYNIFCGNSNYVQSKNIQLMNISDLIKIIWEKNIYSNLESEKIAKILCLFLHPLKINLENDFNKQLTEKFINIFDDPKLKSNPDLVIEYFSSINIDSTKINFTFSAFVMIMSTFAVYMPENENKQIIDSIKHFYKSIVEILENDLFEEMDNINEKSANLEKENIWPESKVLGEAQRMQVNSDKNDMDFLLDSLTLLDKELPELSSLIKVTQNKIQSNANTSHDNKVKIQKMKFPMDSLKVELDEILLKKENDRDNLRMDKLKNVKKTGGKNAPEKPIFFEDLPDAELDMIKYFGNKTIDTLKQRFLKNSMKDIMINSNVYPCLIKEVMLIPRKIHPEVLETLILVLKDQINGRYENAIAKLERAEKDYHLYKNLNSQTDLYFFIMFGNLYESLELNLMSLRYYMKGKLITDKLQLTNPDSALVYCNLGSLLIRLREYEWAFRSFWKAKTIREYTIGGDTIDTATIYNNLGVCAFYLQSYYSTYGYFKLSYEILKEKLGTMLVKSNISKMSNLNFNKEFEFKPMGIYPSIVVQQPNKTKGKKK